MKLSQQELERLLRAVRPTPRGDFVAELERSLAIRRPKASRRRLRLTIGAVGLATGLAAVALVLSVVGLLPFTSGERPAQADRQCRTVVVERRERVPYFARDAQGQPEVRYRSETVPRLVRRCR